MKAILNRLEGLAAGSLRLVSLILVGLCATTAWADTVYSTEGSVANAPAYTPSAGNANVTWQAFNLRSAVTSGNAENFIYLKSNDTDIAETDAAVVLNSITVSWGSGANGGATIGSGGTESTPYLVVTTPECVIVGVSSAGDKWAANNTSTFSFTGVVLASQATYRFYFVTNTSGLSVGNVFSGGVSARTNCRYHYSSSSSKGDDNVACNASNRYSVNCSFSVGTVAATVATVLKTGTESVSLGEGSSSLPVVIEGAVENGVVVIGSGANISQIVTVVGKATTLKLTDKLTADAIILKASTTIDASSVALEIPSGAETQKTTPLVEVSKTFYRASAPSVTIPTLADGLASAILIADSGISVSVEKGVDCDAVISGDAAWTSIKPDGWANGAVPSITVTYTGEDPVTLSFDETVSAASLTLNGNIVAEMANLTVATISGSGTFVYRSNYPHVVPEGIKCTYVGGATQDASVAFDSLNVKGSLKTSGYFSFTGYESASGSSLDVVDGSISLKTADQQRLAGTLTIEKGATFVNSYGSDAVVYNGTFTANIYGTLDMGSTRWSLGGSNNTINLYNGCSVTGAGQGENGALDWIENRTGVVTISGNVTIAASIRNRGGATIKVSSVNATDCLTLSGTLRGSGTVTCESGAVVLPADSYSTGTSTVVDSCYTGSGVKYIPQSYVVASVTTSSETLYYSDLVGAVSAAGSNSRITLLKDCADVNVTLAPGQELVKGDFQIGTVTGAAGEVTNGIELVYNEMTKSYVCVDNT